jgi:hypothetical protein
MANKQRRRTNASIVMNRPRKMTLRSNLFNIDTNNPCFLVSSPGLEIAFADHLKEKLEPRLNDSVGQASPDDRSDGKAHDHHQIRKLEVQYIMQPRKVLLP